MWSQEMFKRDSCGASISAVVPESDYNAVTSAQLSDCFVEDLAPAFSQLSNGGIEDWIWRFLAAPAEGREPGEPRSKLTPMPLTRIGPSPIDAALGVAPWAML